MKHVTCYETGMAAEGVYMGSQKFREMDDFSLVTTLVWWYTTIYHYASLYLISRVTGFRTSLSLISIDGGTGDPAFLAGGLPPLSVEN